MSAEEIELMKQACNLDDERARFYLNASGGNLDVRLPPLYYFASWNCSLIRSLARSAVPHYTWPPSRVLRAGDRQRCAPAATGPRSVGAFSVCVGWCGVLEWNELSPSPISICTPVCSDAGGNLGVL